MKNTLETRLGIFFAAAIIAAVILLEMLGSMDFLKGGYRLHAMFGEVLELKVGDPVKMAGVRIGTVERLTIATNRVQVTMKINQGAEVGIDSKASIRFTGLMGQNYISLSFGAGAGRQAEDGTVLETFDQPDINKLMTKLDSVASGVENLTKSFTGDKIDNLLGPFTDFLNQNKDNLTATISNMKTASDRIVAGEGTVGKLINEDTLYQTALTTVSNLQGAADEIKVTLADARVAISDARQVVADIEKGEGTMGKLLKDETLYKETTEAMSNLREIMQKINRGDGSVGQLVNDETLLKNVKMTLQKLDKVTEGLEDSGPMSVLGMAVNSLF